MNTTIFPLNNPLGAVPGPKKQFYVESIFIINWKYYIVFFCQNLTNFIKMEFKRKDVLDIAWKVKEKNGNKTIENSAQAFYSICVIYAD